MSKQANGDGGKVSPTLSKKINVSEFGTVTKKEFMERAKAAGWTVESKETNGYKNGEYNRRYFNRLAGDDQVRYEERLSKLKTVYSIRIPGQTHFYDITKSEFEYFNSLEYVKINDPLSFPRTIKRTPDKGVSLSRPVTLINQTEQADIFQYALESYSYVLPYNQPLTGGQWVERIGATHELNARTLAVCETIKAVMYV